jgi:small subunit ribosomal protein S17
MPKKVAVGVVTSDRMQKTRRVEIPRLVKHPVYGKYIHQRTICHVHDEEEVSAIGDTVEIIESPPRSKMKRWDLVRVVKKNSEVDVAALRVAREVAETEQQVIDEPGAVAVEEADLPVDQEAGDDAGDNDQPEIASADVQADTDQPSESANDENKTEDGQQS